MRYYTEIGVITTVISGKLTVKHLFLILAKFKFKSCCTKRCSRNYKLLIKKLFNNIVGTSDML